jgi:hypothetical protein
MIVNTARSKNINIMIINEETKEYGDHVTMKRERAFQVVVGDSFFREERRNGRDMVVLAVSVYKRRFWKTMCIKFHVWMKCQISSLPC